MIAAIGEEAGLAGTLAVVALYAPDRSPRAA